MFNSVLQHMGAFTYLPYIIVIIFVGFISLTGLIFKLSKHPPNTNLFGIADGKSLHLATAGCYGAWSSKSLAISRIVSAIYFWSLFLLILTIKYYRRFWTFFTNWNVMFLVAYYSIAAAASILKLHNSESKHEWLGNLVVIMFIIAAPTAFFVTCVDFVLLNHEVTYWNFSSHLITSVTALIEISQNSIPVIWRNIYITLAWALLFLCVIWPLRVNNVAKHWPYDFLDTSTPLCFLWYPGLFLIIAVFFAIFKGITDVKFKCALKYFPEVMVAMDRKTSRSRIKSSVVTHDMGKSLFSEDVGNDHFILR